MSLNTSQIGNIETAGDSDVFRVNVPSSGLLTVYTTGSTDTYGGLVDSDCREIDWDDDDGDGTNFYINPFVAAGNYYVVVMHYSSSRTGPYTLHVQFGGTTDDHGNTCATATPITLSGGIGSPSGSLTAGDYDYFSVDVPSSGTLTAYTTESTDTYGYLKNSGCMTIDYDDDDGDGYNFNIRTFVTAGTYYVAVRHYSSSGTGNYTLSVQFAAGGGTTDDHGNTCATATHITLSSYGIGSRTGNIETVGDIDYFSVDVPQGTLTIFTTGGTDTYGYLKNSSCTELLNGRNDDYLEDRNFSIRQWVPAGRYYVAVKHWNGTGTGDYTLNVEFVTHLFTWPVDPTNRTDGSSFACGDSSPCFWISDTNHDLAIIWRDALSFQRVTASGPHLGADYNLGSGDNDEGEYVYPIAWGTISAVYSDYCGYGNIILVRHDTSFGTYTSMYAHINPLASGMPVEGTLVNPSQPIALVGKGLKSDCFSLYPAHLHFEIRRGDSVAEYATDHDRVGNAYGACIGVDQPTNTCPQQQVNPNEFIIRHN